MGRIGMKLNLCPLVLFMHFIGTQWPKVGSEGDWFDALQMLSTKDT